ncbi:MAG: FxLYD domain-containing protein, partial [Oscillospiraceae bacterium]|nr:FxLYD domain-containing protein [Oscillospiraceae bacterium]
KEGEEKEQQGENKNINNEPKFEITYSNVHVYKNSIGTIRAYTIFEVTNTGDVPLYLSSGSLDLEDENGTLIKSQSLVSCFPDVIETGEKGYYYDDSTIDKLDAVQDLVVLPRPDVKKAKIDNIRLEMSDLELFDKQYFGTYCSGRVINNTDEEQNMVYIYIVLFDSSNNPIGVLFTILSENIKVGDKIGFEASGLSLPDNITANSVHNFKAYAYPMQFQF